MKLPRAAFRRADVTLPLLLALGFQPGCHSEPARSAVLIVVDTLRADHLGMYGSSRPTSPELDAWAKRAVVFDRAFSTSPWTLPSFGSLLTGELPSRHAAGRRVRESNWTFSTRVNAALPTLPEALSEAGFSTGALVNSPFLPPAVGLGRGFATYEYRPPTGDDVRRADGVVDSALRWIDQNREQPFFLMVHVLDPHMNYDAPPPFRGRFTSEIAGDFELPVREPQKIKARAATIGDAERAFIRAAYDEEIAFVDHELARLFTALEERGLWGRLLVVLTADHGEELFDHGSFEHGHTVHQELLHVPLLVWAPGVTAGRRTDPVSLADLPATFAEAMNVSGWHSTFGRSLWPLVIARGQSSPRLLAAEGTLYGEEREAAIRWPLKLTIDTVTGRRHLYQLEQDPEEKSDLAAKERPAALALSRELESTLAAARRGGTSEDVPLDDETREALRALGYVR